MSLWDWIKGKPRRRTAILPSVEQAREREMVATSNARVQLINALAVSRPDVLAAIVFPRAGKLLAGAGSGAGGGDRFQDLLMRKLEADMLAKPADPIEQLMKLQQASRAYRELQEELTPEPGQSADGSTAGVVATIFDNLFNSPFGANLGAALGQVMLSGTSGQQAAGGPVAKPPAVPQPPAHPQLAPVQPAPAPRQGQPASTLGAMPAPNPLLVQGMLALLRARNPETMAGILIDKAGEHEDLATLLDLVLDSRGEDLPVLLNGWVQLNGWGQVAAWLLENYEYTVALVAEIRRLADEADMEQPDPEA